MIIPWYSVSLSQALPKHQGKLSNIVLFKKNSKDDFVNDLNNVDWESVANKEDVDFTVSIWNKLFTNIADRHAPVRKLGYVESAVRGWTRGYHKLWVNAIISTAEPLNVTHLISGHCWLIVYCRAHEVISSSHDPSLRTMCSRNGGSRVNACCCVLLLSCSSFSTLKNQHGGSLGILLMKWRQQKPDSLDFLRELQTVETASGSVLSSFWSFREGR